MYRRNKPTLEQDQLVEEAAQSLATGNLPTHEKWSENQVFNAYLRFFQNEWQYPTRYKEHIDSLCRLVLEYSKGTIRLEPAEFYTGIKGPNVQFLLHQEGKPVQALAAGAYVPPWMRVEKKD